jgi:hypothetical protein
LKQNFRYILTSLTMTTSKTSTFRRSLLSMLALICCFSFAVPSAHALDKDQLVQMTKLGLDESAIKGAIDSAGDDFKLNQKDIEDLRAQGVSESVIDYLKESGHVSGDKGGGDKGGDKQEAAQQEQTGDQPLQPAPSAADQDDTREMTEEELEETVQERAERMREEEQQEQKRQEQLSAWARKLPEVKSELDAGNNMEAARMYLKFLSLKPDPQSEQWYEAKFGLAQALYDEGILSGAADAVVDVLMAGSDRKHFEDAFYMLEDLTKTIGYQPPSLEKMTEFYIDDMSSEFKNNFNYYVGKFFYDYERRKLAARYLQKVEEGEDDYPRARYLLGVAQLDPSIDKKPEALSNFEQAIVAGEEAAGANQEILNLSYLALARVFYEVGLYDVALFYYQKVPSDSARSADATFEKAWTYFMKNDFDRALGVFHTLHSPYYTQWYFPDLYILEATVYLNLCKFKKSKKSLARFQTKYLDERPRLKNFLNKVDNPKTYWKIVTAPDSLEPGAAPDLPKMFVNAVLDDQEFYDIYNVIQLLRKEKAALKANISGLGDFGQQVLQQVNRQLDTKVREGGILVRQKLNEVDQGLERLSLAADQISFDIDSEQKEQMQRQLETQRKSTEEIKPGSTLLIVSDDWMPWPFEGEYWLDEVKSYRSRLKTECVQR